MSRVESHDAAASDDALVAAARRGDREAFEIIYRRYRADIGALAWRLLRDTHATEDVTQETFLKAFRHLDEFELGRPLGPWLATMAKRLCIDEIRRTRRRNTLRHSGVHAHGSPFDVTSEAALAMVERQRLNYLISRALAALRPRDRNVFVLQSIEGWSHERIAEQHGISINAVRNLAWRARSALRRSLGSEHMWGLAWTSAVADRLRRRRLKSRWSQWRATSMDGPAARAVVDGAGAIILGLAATGASFFGAAGPPRPPDGVAAASMQRSPAAVAAATSSEGASRAHESEQMLGTAPGTRMVSASVVLAHRAPGAAGPNRAITRIEVRTPDGRTLVWYEHDTNCGGQGRKVLPQGGPVTVVC